MTASYAILQRTEDGLFRPVDFGAGQPSGVMGTLISRSPTIAGTSIVGGEESNARAIVKSYAGLWKCAERRR